MKPLADTTVAVTRSGAQAGELIAAIEGSGGRAVHLPLLEITDAVDGGAALDARVRELTADDWLVLLSPNGARRLPVGGTPARVAAIAAGTAAALGNAGYEVHLVPEVPSSLGLLDAFASVAIDGSVLIAQAENGRTELMEGLLARGVSADVVIAYRNVMPPIDGGVATTASSADLVVFASPSAVERYHDHVGDAPNRAVCIGHVTAASAEQRGFSVTVAQAPTVEAIVDALVSAR